MQPFFYHFGFLKQMIKEKGYKMGKLCNLTEID